MPSTVAIFLGAAGSEAELAAKLETSKPQFDRDTYRILSKVVNKMRPSVKLQRGETASLKMDDECVWA